MKRVDSSNIDSLHYDHEKKSLIVQFKNGGSYEYLDVSPDKYKELEEAESIGAHLHKHIKITHHFRKL